MVLSMVSRIVSRSSLAIFLVASWVFHHHPSTIVNRRVFTNDKVMSIGGFTDLLAAKRGRTGHYSPVTWMTEKKPKNGFLRATQARRLTHETNFR